MTKPLAPTLSHRFLSEPPSRRRLSVRVGPLPLAAALALGAHWPWVGAQTVIAPIKGVGATQTVVSSNQPGVHTVTTGTLRDGNAFNHLSVLQVGQGDTVGLVVPTGANWLVNVVRDARVQVDGQLQGRLADGSQGGNLLFIDSHGFAVGPTGRVSGGRLVFAAPSTAFVDSMLGDGTGQSASRVSGVLSGQFERSDTGAVQIDGEVHATEGVQIMAGEGAGASAAVSVGGRIQVDGRRAGAAVNLGDLRVLTPLIERDGVIDITTPGNVLLNGKLLADSSHWTGAGAVRVVAGNDIAVGANARVSASGAVGSGAAGGQVALFAQRDIANTPGANLRARGDGAGDGGAIEYSGLRQLNLSGMLFDAGSDTGAAGLVFVDPDDAVVEGLNLTGGAHFVYGGDNTLTVKSGAVINTRKVASGQDATNASVASTGNSGNIVLTAPHITVEADALLDASVVNAGGSIWAAGDIDLVAQNSSSGETLVTLSNANASIDVAGTVKGKNITMEASIESSASFGGVTGSIQQEAVNLLLESLESPIALSLAYVEAKGDATITIRPTALLDATQDIALNALADRSASVEVQSEGSAKANLSAGFAQVTGTTKIDIQSGATLTAGENIALVAASKTGVGMSAAAAGETDDETGEANVASVVFAGSRSDVTTQVTVGANAVLTSDADTLVQAFHAAQYETSAEVTVYGGGTAGVVGALSLQASETAVDMGGSIDAGGHVSLMAMNASSKNAISATSANASEEEEESALAGLPESLEYSQDQAGEDAQAALMDGFMSMASEFSDTAETASGGEPAESKPPALRLAGAMTWSESDHVTRASLGAGARVNAGGDAVVDAQTLVGQLQSVALSEATSETEGEGASKIGLAVAFNYADHAFTTRATVGAGAEITAGHVAVNASTDIPEFYTAGLPSDWSSFSSAYANLMGGTDFLYDGFNTRVGATSTAEDLAAAGAVSLAFMRNDTRAWVGTGAKLTTTVTDGLPWSYGVREVNFESDLVPMLIPINTYTLDKDLGVLGDFVSDSREAPSGPDLDQIDFTRSFDGSAVVRAENHIQTLHNAGGAGSESGSGGGSVGGTFSMVRRNNTAIAGVADDVEIDTRQLDVTAETIDWVLSLSPTSGGGAGIAANGIASYNELSETTRASISREALVTADVVNVDAQLSLGVIAVTGAVTRSENTGVGIGVAMNKMTGDTRAYVGDNDTDGGGADTPEGDAGAIATGALNVQARTDGMIVAVGVAGATAGEEPPPEDPAAEEPASKSTAGNLGGEAAEQSADEQAQLDGNDATMAPLDEASEPAKGGGTDSAASEEPAASKPPSFSIAGAGAIVTNFSDLDTMALLEGAVVRGMGAGSNTVAVQALSDLTQVSVAGGGALSLSKNTSDKFTAAIAGAVAVQKSDDDTTARIVNSHISDLADQSGSLVLQALKSGERTAVATGISLNLSKGSTTSVSVAGSASVTTTTDDTQASMEGTDVLGNVASPTALGVQVVAYDRSRIGAGGGALSVSTGKGSAGVGAAISIVNAKGSTRAQVSDGSITQAHDLAVLALSSQKVVGVAAVGGLQTDASSRGQLMGSFVFNHIGNTLSAGVTDGALVNLTGDLALQAGGAPTGASLDALLGAVRTSELTDYEMASTDNGYTSEFKSAVGGESIVGVAGTLSVTLGGSASSLGLSYVHNDIQTTYGAELEGDVTVAGNVDVAAISRADIVGVSAGVGATKGKFSGMGSASVNLIGQRTQATVSGGSVNAASLDVQSSTTGNTFGLAGNLSFAVGSGSGKAAGAAVAYTQTGTKTYTAGSDTLSTRAAGNAASIKNNTTVNVGAGTVQVQASNVSDLMSVAASGAAADGNVGFAGTVTVNEIADVTDAHISGSTVTAGSVLVQAGEGAGANSARIRSLAGGVSASMGYSGALALGFNTIESTRSAQVVSSTLNAGSAVSVLADAAAHIQTLSVTLAGGKDYALAGSSSTNLLNGSTLANVEYSTLNGAATALTVHASQSGAIESLAGAVSGGGTGAIGGAVAVNLMGQGSDDFQVTSRLKDSVLAAPVAVSLDAQLSGSIQSVAASGSGAGTAAINGSVTTNVIEANVLAEVVGGSQSATGGAFTVSADNQAAISSLAGTISGAGQAAVGAAVSVNEIGGSVIARVQNHTLRASGAVGVDARSSGTIRSVAAGASGAGTTALAGSNTTNSITSTVLAQMSNVTQAAASSSLRVQALDSSTIQSFAGSVAGGGNAAGGAAFALNFLGRTATNADSSKVVKAEVLNSNLNSGGAVQVKALSTSTIESMAMAVGVSGNAAVTGSNTTNLLEDDITAIWSGGSLTGASTSLTVKADDAATVHTLAGNVSGGLSGAFGAAIAVNEVGSQVSATLSAMTLSAAPAVVVDADLRGEIKSVAASGAADGAASVNGSFTTNAVNASVKAQALSLNQSATGGAFTVTADNDADIFSLAGTISGSGGAAVGAAVSVNDIGGDVTARVVDSTLRASGALAVRATASGTVQSIAAGMAGGGAVGLAGSNTTNGITSTVLAQLSGTNMVTSAASVDVVARDISTIQSFAGSVAGGGTAGGGAAVALNFLGRTATDADSSKIVKAEVTDSMVRSTGAVLVNAYSTSVIESIGVAVGVSGTASISGSNTTNLLEDEITAYWTGSGLATTNQLTISARQSSEIDSLAGNVSGSMGAGVGAAVAVNRIGTQTQSQLKGVSYANYASNTGYWTENMDDMVLSAESDNQIDTIAVGMSAGSNGAQGSVAVSAIGATTSALLGADGYVSNVIATDTVAVTANSRDRIRTLAGAVGLGVAGVGAAGGVQSNLISSTTSAGVAGWDTHVNALGNGSGLVLRDESLASAPDLMNMTEVSDAVLGGASFGTRTVKGLAIQATGIQQIGATTAVAGGGAAGAAGAAINVNKIGGSTRAYLANGIFFNDWTAGAHANQSLDVLAANHAMIASSATALAIGSVGVSGSVGTEIIDRSTRAEVRNVSTQAQADARVQAVSTNTVAQIAAGAAGGAVAGVAGSGDVVLLKGETVALVDASTIRANNISVLADGTNASNLVAGAVSYAGVPGGTGVGLSFTVNVSGSTVRALVDDSALAADGAVVVDADNRTESLSVSASAAAGGSFGVAVGAAVSVMEGATEAAVTGTTTIAKRTLATGLLASAGDAPVTINLASDYDLVNTTNQSAVRLSLSDLTGLVSSDTAVVTLTDGETTVTAVRQADGTYTANVSSLADGLLMAQVLISEGGVEKVSTTTLSKSTGINASDTDPVAASKPAALTRIETLSGFSQVDARNHEAVVFVLKSDFGPTADSAASVIVSDGTRQVTAVLNADGSYTADVSSLGDGVLTALVTTTPGAPETARVTFAKTSGAASLSITANETVVLNHNAGQLGVGGLAGVGASANVVVGKSTVDATLSAASVRVSGELTVAAERAADIDMITATGGGGGIAGVSGAVGVLVFGSAPDSDASSELNGDGGTLAQINGATQSDRASGTGEALSASETDSLNDSGRYDTQGAFTGATGSHRTSATITTPSIIAGSLAVRSLDRTSVDNNAGAIALGGAVGVSAGVAITQLGGANQASVASASLIVADNVVIESGSRTPVSGEPAIESRAIAGAGGFVGIGAAVSVATNDTANSAALSGHLQAGGLVSVRALDQTTLLSEAIGASAGALAVGVVTATAAQTGSVGTTLAGSLTSESFTAIAERDASTEASAWGGVAGVFAGAGAGATATDAGTVSLVLGSGTAIDAGSGNLNLSARSNPSAETSAFGVSVAAGAAVGVSVALSEVETNVNVSAAGPVSLRGADLLVTAVLGSGDGSVTADAVAGGGGLLLGLQGAGASASNTGRSSVNLGSVNLLATGDVGISANDAMSVSASATGVGVGFVGAGVAVASAASDSTVSTQVAALGGAVSGNLTISARGDEFIDADAEAGSGGVIAGAGAEATVDHEQDVSAIASTAAAGLTVTGTTTLSADRKVRYDSQTETVNASAFGGSGAVTTASLTGSAVARLDDGAKLTGAQLRVLATNDVERTDLLAVSARGGGGGVIAGAGADANTVINGTATAELGDDVALTLGGNTTGLLELRAYNQLRGSSVGRLDLGGAIPIALVDTEIRSTAAANATIGERNAINVAGEVFVNAMSYVDIEANTITKTYGAAAGAQGDALAHANVDNVVTVGADTTLIGEGAVTLLAGQDRDFWRNKSFVTARADLFNHAAIPVSVNPDADAQLDLTNNVFVYGDAVRSGGTIKVGGIEGTYVVEGKGKVSDWTRDVGELIGISSEYGSTKKTLTANSALSGLFEAGYGNKQVIVINPNGTLDASKTQGNIRYSIGTEDLAATGAAYLDSLYDQLKNYGDVAEVRAFVEAEIAFYLESLVREGFATLEENPDVPGQFKIVAQDNVPGTFLTVQNVRAGSGNVELFGNNVTGNAQLVARADSEILIDNKSPMNIRVKDLIIDSSGGFAKYNGVYLTESNGSDIATYNRDTKTGLALTVDSIDTRGGGAGEELPTLKVLNSYQSTGLVSGSAVIATAPDGSSADLRQDQLRAPEIRVNGLLYNKLGPIILSNTAGSISVMQEDPAYVPRVDGLEVQINAGKNFVLSSPSVSQSIGGSPENLYAVAYNDDQQRKLDSMGVVRCGTARAGDPSATSFSANCLRNGSGGIYANGGIFLGARYLNINGTIQSGQPDYTVTLTNAGVGTTINNWETQWTNNRGAYLAQGRSSLVQVAGRLPTDNEADINKRFANGTITQTQRDNLIAAMDARRKQPIVYYDAEDNRLKVAATEVTGGLVEVVGSIINTGGGVIRALDGYARFDIDNQTGYGLDLLGLDTGGEAGVVRITDLSKPVYTGTGANRRITSYEVTSYQRDANGVFKATTTAGRGGTVIGAPTNSTLLAPNASRPELLATFSYAPVTDSTYVWSAGYEFGQEKRYWYQKSSSLWGAINLGSIKWNSVDTITKTSTAMPEGIYVTTASPPAQNFWMGTQTFTTDAEKEIYYRSWKKCGTLCFKKTYYVDYRTEVGKKDVFTQRVAADRPIAIELVGYTSGNIEVESKAGIRISGGITNDSGMVSIKSTQGSIEQLSGGTAVTGDDLRFYAATGIGSEGAPINVITGDGSFTATSTSGNIAFQSLGGALRINQVSTTGKVWLLGDEDIVGVNPNTVHVSGSRIQIAAPRGGIGAFNLDGSVKSTLNIQTEDSAGGGITAHAARGIALKQGSGNLWVDQVASSGGDVYIEAAGDLIDNNRNETRDVRTEEELLALWNAASLQGDSAEVSRQRTLTNTRSQFRRYWSLRNAQTTSIDSSTGAVTAFTADAYDPNTYVFSFSSDEKARLTQSGMTAAQITALEDGREQELSELHKLYGATHYQVSEALIISEVNAALVASGSAEVDALSTWSDTELKSPLPKAIFSKSSTDTQTRIEEPNVVGNRVVLRPGGKIGRDEGAVTIDLRKAGGLTIDDQLTIMSAESDDMSLDKDTWQLTVVKKDTFNVLSNKLNVTSNGFVYLGADETDAYPTGGNANLEQVTGNGEIRIKVSGSILNASNSTASVIQGHKAILEAASGSIGTADKAVTLSLTGGGNASAATLVARAQEGIWINQTGDMRVADVYSPGAVTLTAQGAMIDARGVDRTRALEAGEATLIAQGGAVGSAANPFVVKASATGGVNATSASGYSVYLAGAETGLTVKNINSGGDIYLDAAQKDVIANGDLSATGRVDVQATQGIRLQGVSSGSDVSLIAYGGDADVLGNISAAGPVNILASGGMSTRGITSGQDITLEADSGNLDVDGDLTAAGGIDVTAGGTGSITMASGSLFKALSGGIYVSADNVGLSTLDAARAVVVVADGDITDTSDEAGNINAAGLGVTLSATGAIGVRGQSVDVLTRERSKLVATAAGDAFISADSAPMRISQVSAGGSAVLSSAFSLIDDRGTRAQAVDATNIELIADGDIGQTTLPMTVKTAADGAVRNAAAGGSLNLYSPLGALRVLNGSATAGRMALNGNVAGLSLGGVLSAGQGMALTAGVHEISVTEGAKLSNGTGTTVMQGRTISMADGATIDGGVGTVVLSATGDITLTGIKTANNTSGAIVVSSTGGAVLDGGDSQTDLDVTSANGAVVLSALHSIGNTQLAEGAVGRFIETEAPVLTVTSKTGSVALDQGGTTRNATISARLDAELIAENALSATKIASSLGSVRVQSEQGSVSASSITSAQDVLVRAAGKIELLSITSPRDITLHSTGTAGAADQGITATALTAGRDLSITAAGAQANSRFSALTSRTGSLSLDNGGTVTITGSTSGYGQVDMDLDGQSHLGAITSRTAGVNVSSAEALKTGAVRAVGAVALASQDALSTGAVTSTGGNVALSAHNASLTYGSVSAAGLATLSTTRAANSTAQ
ncbi:leukotoxin LktA family filamentous adhesin, partial [Hydrogenophaga sp.]|uniref:leukotoxin LktA family filamentous adhesin n=1 Tax=Hydrogenophaga sp. TaxID=1904254 RepID=UPI003F6D52B6